MRDFHLKALPLTEAQIERQILDTLAFKKIFAWKNQTSGYFDSKQKRFRKQSSPYALNGAPDVIAIIDGFYVGFEVKSATGRQSDAQKAFETRIREAMGFYYLVRSVKDLEFALDSVFHEIQLRLRLPADSEV